MLEGRFFPPASSRVTPARAAVVKELLRIEDLDGALLIEAPARQIRVSPRLGNVPRRFEFRNGARFETSDNEGADALVAAMRGGRKPGLLYRIERSWRWIAAAVLVAALVAWLFVVYGIPAGALWLAEITPDKLKVLTSEETLKILDEADLGKTQLSPADRKRASDLFAHVAAHEPRGVGGYQLLFRQGGPIGANAFALPDGRIVMTDELWKLVRNDDEIEGVFAHEMAHVNHAHGLQRVYQATLIPAALALLTGDPTQFSQIATVLPGILVESSYSRAFEQQADDDAAATLKRMGAKPSRLAEFLERLDAQICGKTGCPPSWIGTHPETTERAARLRQEERAH
jgi:Zn-dependent protease with chaperone function